MELLIVALILFAAGVFFAADFLTMPQPQRFFVRLNLGF